MDKEKISSAISVLTGGFALANIYDVLSIIVLILSISNILFNASVKIYKHIKEKNIKAVGETINEAKDELEKLENNKRIEG